MKLVREEPLQEQNGPSRSLIGFSGLRAEHVQPVIAVLGALVVWQIFVMALRIQSYILPPPTEVAREMVVQWQYLLRHAGVTTYEVVLGFVLSVAVGLPCAVAIVYSRLLENTAYPLLVSSQAIPKIAIAPLFVVWFGFGLEPKILVAVLVSFFPIVIDTALGLRSVEPEMLHLARSMGTSSLQTFLKISFPSALPSVFSGLKIAITLAVVGAVVGEFIGSDQGLGYVLLIANGNLDTKLLFAATVVLSIIGIVMFLLVHLAEKWALPWHVSQRAERPATGTL